MRKEVKSAAEMYALGALSQYQVEEMCDFVFDECREAFIYAAYYSSIYDEYIRNCEELEAKDVLWGEYIDDILHAEWQKELYDSFNEKLTQDEIDDLCMHNIYMYSFEGEFAMSNLTPLEFCEEWDIVPEELINY